MEVSGTSVWACRQKSGKAIRQLNLDEESKVERPKLLMKLAGEMSVNHLSLVNHRRLHDMQTAPTKIKYVRLH